MSQAEYILYRQSHTGSENILARARFPESRSIFERMRNQNGTILEIGCASGALSIHLSYYHLHQNIIGMDVDRPAVHQARGATRYLKLRHIDYILGSATHLPIRNETIDFILCQEVIEHIPDPLIVLKESQRTLRTNGKILITTPVTAIAPLSSDWLEIKIHGSLSIDKFAMHLHRFKPKTLVQDILRSGFTIQKFQFTNQYLDPLIILMLTLWRRRNLQKEKTRKTSKSADSMSWLSAFPNLIVMAAKTFEYKLLGWLPVGSNVTIIADKQGD